VDIIVPQDGIFYGGPFGLRLQGIGAFDLPGGPDTSREMNVSVIFIRLDAEEIDACLKPYWQRRRWRVNGAAARAVDRGIHRGKRDLIQTRFGHREAASMDVTVRI